MTEAQIKSAIVDMNNSEEYLKLRKYYAEESIFKTLHISRDEKVHSNFIAWLLKPTSNHELNHYPLQKFLQMLSIVAGKENNFKAQFSEEYATDFLLESYDLADTCRVETEVCTGEIAGFDNNGRIDLLLELTFKNSNTVLPIIIENKVLSTENAENKKSKPKADNKQTEKYFEWSKVKYSDTSKYRTPILIFLAPDFERDIKCKCDSFIKVSYQNLVDYVIEPCLMNVSSNQAKIFIENYLRCLSNSTINETLDKKEGRIMAFASKEKVLLEKFYEKNKDLFNAVLTMLSTDENLSDDERENFKVALDTSSSRKSYEFEGKKYGVGPLVLAVVKKHVQNNPLITFAELQEAFPKNLRSGDVVKLSSDVSDKDKGKVDGKKRYFVGSGEIISLNDGSKVLVSNQWTKEKIPNFIERATELGYTITPV